MSLLDSLLGGGQQGSLMQLAERFGLNGDQMQNVVGQLAPALSAGLMQHTQQNGLPALMSLLQSGNAGQYAQNPQMLQQPQAVATGNGILGHLFGNPDVSRQVAETTAQQTGVGSDIIKKMLPLVAIMAASELHKKTQQPTQNGQPEGMLGELTHFLTGGPHHSMADDVLGMLKQRVSSL